METASEMRKMARRAPVWLGAAFAASLALCAPAEAWISPAADAPALPHGSSTLERMEPAPGAIRLAAKAAAAHAPAASSDIAGRYSVLRDAGKDTGCMVTLSDKGGGRGGNKASLAPGCRDQGIVIFDPVGWQITGGRLVLTARKGHSTHLDQQTDGTWLKDPKEGKSLGLKKM
jgi:hypothetical protein